MDRSHDPRPLPKKVRQSPKKKFQAEVFIDLAYDFVSMKIAPGVESKSYLKEGIVYCEDEKGNVIEIQVLNLSELLKSVSR